MFARFSACFAASLLVACASGGRAPADLGHASDGPRTDGAHDGSAADLGATDLGGTDLGAGDLGASDLGPADLGAPDLGAPDLGHPDLGPPVDMGGGGCTSAAACSDGIACNGVERCIAGACSPGTSIVCDDGIACSRDACMEPTGACTFTRDDSLCAPGQACTASTASGCASTSTCSESPCKLVAPQCGCAGGLACTISGTSRVCAAPGTGAVGAACGTTGCTTGNLCVTLGAGATAPTGCERFCGSDGDCSGAGALCILTLNDGTGGSIPGVTLCTLSCNPLSGTGGCPTSSTCRVYTEMGGAMRALTHCGAIGAGTQGATCATVDDCAAGFDCVNTTGVGTATTCARYCNVLTGSGCTGARTCVGFTTPLTVGSTEYGVCI